MAYLLVILVQALLGGIWRRVLGSAGTGLGRMLKLFLAVPLTWPIWFMTGDPLWMIAGAAAAIGFWTPGHQTDSWKIWLRYGPFAVGYWWFNKHWNDKFILGKYLTNYMEWGELVAGFLFWGTLAAVGVFLV